MVSRTVVVTIPEGLHARPAAVFAQAGAGLAIPVTVRRAGRRPAPAASLLSVLALGARAGDEVTLEAEGPGAEEAVETLARILQGGQAAPPPPGSPGSPGPTAPPAPGAAGAPRAALAVRAPLAGVTVPLTDVPDPVFAQGMVGPGMAIDPAHEGVVTVVAPVAGTLTTVHPHAFVVTAPDGRALLVHLGVDTVRLRGAGFTVLARAGDPVEAGDAVVRWDPGEVATGCLSVLCPVVALEAAGTGAVVPLAAGGSAVGQGEDLFIWT